MTTRAEPGDDRGGPGLGAIMSERRMLINLAYRLLGSLADAEDVVQETCARWCAMSAREQQAIASPGAWSVTVAGRICLNLLGSARARRETYVGDWIPEPLPEPTEWIAGRSGAGVTDPADRVTLDESVTMAFLVVLDSMTPAERVAFVLHDVFRYPFGEVAGIVGRTPAACRQLASSARRRIRTAQVPAGPGAGQAGIVRRFRAAWEAKDIDALIGLLDPDATATADGGGLAVTHLHPIVGGEQIARAYAEIARVAGDRTTFLECTVNGLPGLAARQDGSIVTVFAFEIAGDRIRSIWAVRNPEKLRPWRIGRGAIQHTSGPDGLWSVAENPGDRQFVTPDFDHTRPSGRRDPGDQKGLTAMSERLQRNQLVIDEFRSAGGVVGGDFEEVPLLLLTTTGARSGQPRTMPMTYLRDGERLVVFAANGGRENHPAWYHNLLADPAAGVEVGTETYGVTAAEVEGAERERLWVRQLEHTPYFAGFQERAGRRIPVVALTPTAR